MLLYGASLIYGFTGTVSFAGIALALARAAPIGLGLIFGLVFLIAGLAFKISAVPFHMWTPDVYEGAPTPVTAFFAAAPKVAALAIFVRAMVDGLSGRHPAMAADHRLRVARLDGAWRLRRDRPVQHQAADGLFLDRPYGLRAGRPCRRHRLRRAGRRRLYRHLHGDDARHLRLHHRDAPGSRSRRVDRGSGGPVAHQSGDGGCCLPRSCSRLPASRRSPASSPSSTCSRPPSTPSSMCWRWSAC